MAEIDAHDAEQQLRTWISYMKRTSNYDLEQFYLAADAIAQERARAERLKKALDAALVDLSLAETTAGDQYNELRVRIQDLQRRLRAALKESEDGNAG